MTQNLVPDASPQLDAADLRAAVLAHLKILDTVPEQEFDTVVRLAQRSLKCKIALVSLLDIDRQWFKANVGLSACETPIGQSFCAHAVQRDDILVVPDASADPRFASNPLVVGAPFIRFYAGVPIRTSIPGVTESVAIGTLCVIDDKPRSFCVNDAKILRDLTQLVEAFIQTRAAMARVATLAEERQDHLQRLDRKQRQFRQAERMANIGSWRLGLVDNVAEWSEQVFVIHDLPVGAMPNHETAVAFYPPHARLVITSAVERTIRTGQPFDIETDLVTANGILKRVRSIGEIEIADGQPVGIIGVFQDITAQHRMEQELRRNASVDDLTQIGNRAGCNRAIEDRIAAARERNGPLALILIDLDGFKLVNDRCGHLAGDELLRLIGSRLQSAYLANCFVGRLGGDEFVVLVSSNEDCARIDQIVRALLLDLRQSVSYSGGVASVSGTVGIAWLDASVRGRSDLLHRADQALYEAKRTKPGSAKTFGGSETMNVDVIHHPAQLRIVA